jgi:hypothetical protein
MTADENLHKSTTQNERVKAAIMQHAPRGKSTHVEIAEAVIAAEKELKLKLVRKSNSLQCEPVRKAMLELIKEGMFEKVEQSGQGNRGVQYIRKVVRFETRK